MSIHGTSPELRNYSIRQEKQQSLVTTYPNDFDDPVKLKINHGGYEGSILVDPKGHLRWFNLRLPTQFDELSILRMTSFAGCLDLDGTLDTIGNLQSFPVLDITPERILLIESADDITEGENPDVFALVQPNGKIIPNKELTPEMQPDGIWRSHGGLTYCHRPLLNRESVVSVIVDRLTRDFDGELDICPTQIGLTSHAKFKNGPIQRITRLLQSCVSQDGLLYHPSDESLRWIASLTSEIVLQLPD